MANLFGYELEDAKFLLAGSPAIEEVDLRYANTIEFTVDSTTLTFEGDADQRQVFITSGLSAAIRPDCITLEADEALFGKTPVVAGLPAGVDRATYYGETTETRGVTCGFWGRGFGIFEDGGGEEIVNFEIRVFRGTLTLGAPPNLQTKQKAGQRTYNFSAVKTSVDINGDPLPDVPTGGARYWIGILSA